MGAQWNMSSGCGTDEQLVFDDVVYGAVLGRPVFVVSATMCTPTGECACSPWSTCSGSQSPITAVGAPAFIPHTAAITAADAPAFISLTAAHTPHPLSYPHTCRPPHKAQPVRLQGAGGTVHHTQHGPEPFQHNVRSQFVASWKPDGSQLLSC